MFTRLSITINVPVLPMPALEKANSKKICQPFDFKDQSIAWLPPAFHQAFLNICQYPFKLLGGERHGESERHCESAYLKPKNITQWLGWVWNPDLSSQSSGHLQLGHHIPHERFKGKTKLEKSEEDNWYIDEHRCYLQCTTIGPAIGMDCCLLLTSWRMCKTGLGSFGTPWSGHPV